MKRCCQDTILNIKMRCIHKMIVWLISVEDSKCKIDIIMEEIEKTKEKYGYYEKELKKLLPYVTKNTKWEEIEKEKYRKIYDLVCEEYQRLMYVVGFVKYTHEYCNKNKDIKK